MVWPRDGDGHFFFTQPMDGPTPCESLVWTSLVAVVHRVHSIDCGLLLQMSWCGGVVCVLMCLYLSVLVTTVSPANSAEPIAILFGDRLARTR